MKHSLSIITVCYNAGYNLKLTIESILKQTKVIDLTIEHLIIDNQSSDSTKDVISEYRRNLTNNDIKIIHICEFDKGIYDAMNKGVTLANSEWLLLLNAGDTFYEKDSLKNIAAHLNSKSDVLVGYYNRLNPSGEIKVKPPAIQKIKDRMIFCHQALIFRSSVHRKYKYNLSYKIAADYDAILRMYLNYANFEYIDVCLVNYDVAGISAKKMVDTHKEMFLIRKKNNVIDNSAKAYTLYFYGLLKRVILSSIPQKLRWELVKIKLKLFKQSYV